MIDGMSQKFTYLKEKRHLHLFVLRMPCLLQEATKRSDLSDETSKNEVSLPQCNSLIDVFKSRKH